MAAAAKVTAAGGDGKFKNDETAWESMRGPQANNVCFHLKARKADPTCLFIFSNRTSNAVNYFPRREISSSRDSG